MKHVVVVLLLVSLFTGCVQTTPAAGQPLDSIWRLTAREAYDMAYEHASARYDNLHLFSIGAGGTVIVSFKQGEAPIQDGYSKNWIVTFERKHTDTAYTLVFVNIRDGEIPYDCFENEDIQEISEDSWDEHARKTLVDISAWNIDSPKGVEIAKQSGGEGLGTMSLTIDSYNSLVADKPVYTIALAPTTGGGGKGLTVYIDLTDGSVLKTTKPTWR